MRLVLRFDTAKWRRYLAAIGLCAGLALRLCGAATPVPVPDLVLGVAWYPEQWPEERWDKDLALMQAAGINMVRVGEFAWSRMEPAEGRYDLGWLQRAIDKAAAHHIVTVIGTPTDAPPAWLTYKYPDTLRIDENGNQVQHGNRRQFSYTSPRYREVCRRIVAQLAIRFGHNPNVIGWQIGNEYSEDSFDRYTREQFHIWLRQKYKHLGSLNRHWTTEYWSQTYDRWDEIPLASSHQNPGLLLDYRRFVTDIWRSFQRNQFDVIRAHADRGQFVTTNFGGLAWTDRFDHYAVARDLTFISWDDYVGQGHLDANKNGALHDFVRGWKRQNFWVMETQPASVNWAPVSNSLDLGETREMAWQAVGHGADCVAYWQWRSALNGQEQYHGALVGPDGEPLPVYREIEQVGKEFAQAAAALKGTAPHSDVALLVDYDSRWALEFQPHSQRYDQQQVLLSYYRELRAVTQSVDIVNPDGALDGYKVVIAPFLNVLSAELADHLKQYVSHGGHLVLGPRSGMKDEFNALNVQRQPGPLVDLLQGRVEQYYALLDRVPLAGKWGVGSADVWAEMLSAREPETQALMTYGRSNGFLDGQPAVLTRAAGSGRITYIGALLDGELMKRMAGWLRDTNGLQAAFGPLPENVEVCRRAGNGREIDVLINHSQLPADVTLPRPMHDLLSGRGEMRRTILPPRGVAVLEASNR